MGQSALTEPELLGAQAVTQTLHSKSLPCSITIISSMFFVYFCLFTSFSIAGERKCEHQDFNHHLMKRRPINFSKLQFITNEFTLNVLGTPR
jgi:hypothetical protein